MNLDDKLLEHIETMSSIEEDERKIKKQILSRYITGISNYSVQYNFQAISVALLVMTELVCTKDDDECKQGHQEVWVSTVAAAVIFAGAIFGQLTMGYAADVIGRNKAMLFTLGLASIASLLSSAVPSGDAQSIYLTIILCRFILGVGLGGVYPLSAIKAAEDNSNSSSGNDDQRNQVNISAAAWSFFWQSPGSMSPWCLAYIMTYTSISTDSLWRLLLGVGAIPAAIVVILSMIEINYYSDSSSGCSSANNINISKQPTTIEDYSPTMNFNTNEQRVVNNYSSDHIKSLLYGSNHVDNDEYNNNEDTHSSVILASIFTRENLLKLLGTGGSWFLYDIAYYGVNLFGDQIVASTEDFDDVVALHSLRVITSKQLIALSMGIPACIISIYLIKPLGSKRLQILGFIIMVIMFLLMAVLASPLKSNPSALFAIYCLLLFSLSFGPNVTTFIIPAEVYPAHIRGTFNGISAAMGKFGAASGSYLFGALAPVTSYAVILSICSALSAAGAVLTYYCITIEVNRRGSSYLLLDEEKSYI